MAITEINTVVTPSAQCIDHRSNDAGMLSRSRVPLRVGIWIDTRVQPRWCHKVVADIKNSSFAELVVVMLSRQSEHGLHIVKKDPLLFRAYRWLDDRLFRVSPDAFEEVSIDPLLTGSDPIPLESVDRTATGVISVLDVGRIQKYQLDVVIRFGKGFEVPKTLEVFANSIAKHGIWSLDHAADGPPGFWEVIEGQTTTASLLRILGDESREEKVIYRSHAMTDPRSMKINRSNLYWKSCRFVSRKLKELHERGREALESAGQQPVHDSKLESGNAKAGHPRNCGNSTEFRFQHGRGVPGNGKMGSLLFSFGRRFLAAKTNRLLRWDQWVLAYQIGDDFQPSGVNLSRLQKIIPPRDRFWADPCPVKKDGKYYIFLEELVYQNRRGHLAVMEMSADGVYRAPVKILETGYHLSNPSIFEFQGCYYMLPETSRNKTLELYRCVEFPFRWELLQVMMEDVKAVDATVVEHRNRWWMFVNLADGKVSDNYDELFLFHADTPLGPWHEHKQNPIKSDVRSARPAGRLFCWNGDWYRPAQDCSRRYGHAITINKIVRWDLDEYQEIEVAKILPEWGANLVGTHTFNQEGGLTVVDGLLRRPKIL